MNVKTPNLSSPWYSAAMAQKTSSHPFGKKMASARKRKNLSQTELGKLMGVSRGMVAYYESSAKNPTVEVIENASRALEVGISTLLEDAEPAKKGPKSKIQQLTDKLSELPRSKQKVVIEMLEGFLDKTVGA